MKALKLFNVLYGGVALIWLTTSLFHDGFNPSVQLNGVIIGVLVLLLGIDEWMDDRKEYALFYFFIASVSIFTVMI
ncbi:hypothetical protein ACQ4XT_14210 [Halobacillus faecis]